MSKLLTQLRTLSRSNREAKLRARGYWPGAETMDIRLWWNDEDECIIEERSRDYERGH